MHRWTHGGRLAVVSLLALLAGCSSVNNEVHQFHPLPRATVGAHSLDPVHERSVTDLLREAEASFNQASQSQEAGDQQAALRHYSRMLDLLAQADLDPAIFYSLRSKFEGVLEESRAQSTGVRDPYAERLLKPGEHPPISAVAAMEIPFPLPEPVLQEIEAIQFGYPKNFQRGLDRSAQYLPYIKAEFAKAGLPPELVWLASVESLFQPTVVSRAGATGMWQFMKATAGRFDLAVDTYLDERNNWEKSTQAAIEYLKCLHDHFDGNWALAVSAYNMGEGGLARAISGNGGETDWWTLLETPPAKDRIPQETKKYYARVLATAIVASNPQRYGFTMSPARPEQTSRVAVNGMYSLSELNKASGLPAGTLERLNPDLIRQVTPPSRQHHVAVPATHRETFAKAVVSVPQLTTAPAPNIVMAKNAERGSGGSDSPKKSFADSKKTHTVRKGETLTNIAKKYGTSTDDLLALNKMRSASGLKAGQRLKIPGAAASGADTPEPPAAETVTAEAPKPAVEEKSYTVKSGDTLYEIAKSQNVAVNDLLAWNDLEKGAALRVGQKLKLRTAAPQTLEHTVAKGEFPSVIAEKYGVKTSDLLAWNGLTSKSTLKVGQKLKVQGGPVAVAAASEREAEAPLEKALEHVVAKGETPGVIAEKYGIRTSELLAANNLSSNSTIQVNQKLRVPNPKKSAGADSAEKAGEKEPSPAEKKAPEMKEHIVAKGESPSAIAARYSVKTSELLAWNGLKPGDTIDVGDRLKVAANAADKPTAAEESPKAKAASAAASTVHVVAKGDSPYTIAQKYKVKVEDLLAWNNLSEKSTLQVGQKLAIRGAVANAAEPASKAEATKVAKNSGGGSGTPTEHVVAAGHNPTVIARRYGVKVSDLYQWNGWSNGHTLKVGDRVLVYH